VTAGPVISYQDEHHFACTPAELWAAIEQFEQFERWWPWLQEFRLEGDSLRDGSLLHGVVAPPLPYRMRLRVELTRCLRPLSIEAHVHGDLEGPARLVLHPHGPRGTATRVEATWTVEMMQQPMRVASRVAHPLLQWGHDRVVDVTVARFRRFLATGL
jgi:carbon monoxide dehydrogenase subunit G